ncbi:hypothetical protein D3C80_1943310 [compost metagenome]
MQQLPEARLVAHHPQRLPGQLQAQFQAALGKTGLKGIGHHRQQHAQVDALAAVSGATDFRQRQIGQVVDQLAQRPHLSQQ